MKIFLYIVLSFCLVVPVFAQEGRGYELDAIDVLQENTHALLAIVSADSYHSKGSYEVMRKSAEDLVMRLFSFEDFTMLAVGKRWHSFSEDEQEQLTSACTELLRTTYIDYLDEYDNEQIKYVSSTKANNDTRAQVDAIATVKGESVPISFRMLKSEDGGWQVYDVLIEGISLVKNYRMQFAELLLSHSAEEVSLIIIEKNKDLLTKKGQ